MTDEEFQKISPFNWYADASEDGWGVCSQRSLIAQGRWRDLACDDKESINVKELFAARMAVYLASVFGKKKLILFVDNADVWVHEKELVKGFDVDVRLHYIPSNDNPADFYSRNFVKVGYDLSEYE